MRNGIIQGLCQQDSFAPGVVFHNEQIIGMKITKLPTNTLISYKIVISMYHLRPIRQADFRPSHAATVYFVTRTVSQ